MAGGPGIPTGMCHCLYQFLLVEARGERDGGPDYANWKARVRQGNRAALSAALRFDGCRSLCYIECFSRESLRAGDGPVPACSGHRVRSRLRVVRGRSTWAVSVPKITTHTDSCRNKSG